MKPSAVQTCLQARILWPYNQHAISTCMRGCVCARSCAPTTANQILCCLTGWEPVVVNLGHCYRKQQRWGEAMQVYERALGLCPGQASTYAALGFTKHLQASSFLSMFCNVPSGCADMINHCTNDAETARFALLPEDFSTNVHGDMFDVCCVKGTRLCYCCCNPCLCVAPLYSLTFRQTQAILSMTAALRLMILCREICSRQLETIIKLWGCALRIPSQQKCWQLHCKMKLYQKILKGMTSLADGHPLQTKMSRSSTSSYAAV